MEEKRKQRRSWAERMEAWFPDREFFMRSQGEVRFIRVSATLQRRAAATAATIAAGVTISMAVMGWMQVQSSMERVALLEREAKIQSSEERVAAYREDLGAVAEDLQKRQDYIEDMMEMAPTEALAGEEIAIGDDTVTDSSGEAAEMVDKVSMAVPEAVELAQVEARQLAFVENLTRVADRRSARAMWALRQLGLDPNAVVQQAQEGARGGPLERIGLFDTEETIDPRFERLGLSLAKMAALEASLESVPQLRPTPGSVSSPYGFRSDPFTGRPAMHRGIDFRGPVGAPIYATGKGVVTFVGWKGGYGKVIDVDHGQGIVTRYAHLSRFGAKVGDHVVAGQVIAELGNTGRSTGPHLHFEVRINNQPVNPRPFLELAPDVLKKARSTDPRRSRTRADA